MKLQESTVKRSLSDLNWEELRRHLGDIHFSGDELERLCSHVRRHSRLICKYPNDNFERRREKYFLELESFVRKQLGVEAAELVCNEVLLTSLIERGYRQILESLDGCTIGSYPATVRVSGSVSLACQQYHELMIAHDKALSEAKEVAFPSGVQLADDQGGTFSPDAISEGLAETVAMTVIMEAYRNDWFVDDLVVVPKLPPVGSDIRDESTSTLVHALCWRQWQRLEKRRRFLGGELQVLSGSELPPGAPKETSTVFNYMPDQNERVDREFYDFIANVRLKDRLIQNYVEMEFETNITEKATGIKDGALLPPKEFVSTDEVNAGLALSELLGYSITDDMELPCGIRLIEWVRGFIVLKELAKTRTERPIRSGDDFAIVLSHDELVEILVVCGLDDRRARLFIERVSLHRSSRDMFDSPLIRIGQSNYLLFTPAVLDLNVVMAILSNISTRSEQLSRKGKAFEHSIREGLRKRDMNVFAFSASRNGKQYEYDAIVPWQEYMFVFECKNRSLSGNDPVQAYYFDLDIFSQASQARRLADSLEMYPDIIEMNMGKKYVGKKIIPCVLHSLPYSRVGDLQGVFFLDASSLFRFFDDPYFRIKTHHRVGNKTIVHRIVLQKLWQGERPTPDDFLEQLQNPTQVNISIKHLEYKPVQFAISQDEMVIAHELERREMSADSICKALDVDPDVVRKEIDAMSLKAKKIRTAVTK